jgi:hypothetical protein
MKQMISQFESNVIDIKYGPWYCEDISVDIEHETINLIYYRDIESITIQFNIK